MAAAPLRQHSSTPLSAGRDSLLDEHAKLAARIRRLSTALEASTSDNARLRRALGQARVENRQLRGSLAPRGAHSDPRTHVRTMLADPGSRNP
jgi:hypothetical protein